MMINDRKPIDEIEKYTGLNAAALKSIAQSIGKTLVIWSLSKNPNAAIHGSFGFFALNWLMDSLIKDERIWLKTAEK